ncbi:MAG: DUF87 domain-containing protein [Anaerolineae bacterium]|nr:DUF87 domain-containing protein [Anaerolineae bacterium]
MQIPYIYTSPRVMVRQAVDFDNERGVIYKEIGGEHAIWAARVPFLPAMMSADFTRLDKQRILLVMQRQFRFIYDLAHARENQATFELRFIATPNPVPGQPNLIDIIFLGKVFATRQRTGQLLAEKLWDKFVCNFPLEDPFNYPLEPVTDEREFWRYYEPISFNELQPTNVLEIRKYEDIPIRSTAPLGRVERKGDYIAHPFVPNVDFSPMTRFFTALATQSQKCYVGISLRPTRMFDQEVFNVSFAIGQFKKTAIEDDDITEEYIRTRSRIGVYVYQPLMQEREQLVMVRVYVIGEHEAPRGLAEALGSEMMGNAENKYPTQWAAAQPTDEEMAVALNNLRYLEHDFWGYTIASPPLERLRYLASAQEAYGAFRLPVPPESGYVPGVLVKEEPFVASADELELRRQARANLNDPLKSSQEQEHEKKIELGIVYHRGNPTPQSFRINVRDLTRHALIAGSTGSGKSTTIKHLLAQLWLQHGVPFLVLYPLDKPDYRELRGFGRLTDNLLIFTLGDESTSPFRFNPFEVPEGLLLKTHLSRLMRVFTAAFTLHDPLPMIYREALRQVYREKGWNTILERGMAGRDYPIMSDFYQAIRDITDSLNYGREVQDNVRQASVIRIGDLLENAGYVVNVRQSMPFSTILNQPTVMEIGRVGSIQDTSLLMGFLLMRFAEEVERHPRPADLPHITVVEEAHRLMAEVNPTLATAGDSRSAAGEDFSNILSEVRGYGEGIIIAEQIPTLLVKGAIGNTYIKLMHWLEDAPSFDLFTNIMNLNDPQREYARTLTPGFAIVRSPYGRPVHVKVPEFGDQTSFDPIASQNISDEQIKTYMELQRQKLGLDVMPVIKWEAGLQAISQKTPPSPDWSVIQQVAKQVLRAPMRTCAYCKPLQLENKCPYQQVTLDRLQDSTFQSTGQVDLMEALIEADTDKRWTIIRAIGQRLEPAAGDKTSNDQRDAFYCCLAHLAEMTLSQATSTNAADNHVRYRYRTLLYEFHSQYERSK